tara:strand:- start:582 stop:785 length:204 start_codon:yes stop_codon:yes gene_type:complete
MPLDNYKELEELVGGRTSLPLRPSDYTTADKEFISWCKGETGYTTKVRGRIETLELYLMKFKMRENK